MIADRLADIRGFSIDSVAAAAGNDPDVLRLENLDTDLAPPASAVEATRRASADPASNTYLPFEGRAELRSTIAERERSRLGLDVEPDHVVVTAGGTEAMLDVVLALTDPGDEIVLTDPTYAGMIHRVRLAGGVPRLAALTVSGGVWRLEPDALEATIGPRTRAIFLMNPSIPTGMVLDEAAWQAIAHACSENDLWLFYNAAMERIVFDGRAVVHPATIDGMAGRTITIGSMSKEYRMIGWRVGWAYGPAEAMEAIKWAHIYNVVTPPGIGQAGALAALDGADDRFDECLAEWQRRRDVVADALAPLGGIRAAGGWSQVLDVRPFGLTGPEAARALLEAGRVAATPMTGWGDVNGDGFVRFVFSNEPVERLGWLGERVERAIGAPS